MLIAPHRHGASPQMRTPRFLPKSMALSDRMALTTDNGESLAHIVLHHPQNRAQGP
jgi:hypothetical protein